ncbi:serine/arginine repetitive matrix protein 2-like isoform X1 [Ricinus communis]|uniref:serine/arginine repetitive matrix protein 2-like isoform X1 n=1 Tax=Ricinus communis TaxID=3988 RepID=UPI00201A34DF|nr:serine/arginine repetitive matrix protein 2-like isoform X1 [Ricinus communis]
MFSQGGYNSQSGQGPQKPRPPPYLQHHSQALPPPLSHNFQQGPLLPSPPIPPRPGQPGLPIYQHGPLAPHFSTRQVPPGGMPSPGQPFLHRPPTISGSAPLLQMYSTAQQNPQHSYLAPGPPPPRNLPPTISQGPVLYRAPISQLPPQPIAVQGIQQIPPPPPPLPTSSFPTFALFGSSSDSSTGNSSISSVAPLPLPPPPPLPASAPPPVPSSSPPPYSSTLSGSKSGAPPPKPAEEIVQKIEELCQLIAKNGSSYEDMSRQKENENPLFKFLFGGEPGSEAAIAHGYFLWMKKRCKLDGIEHAMPTNHSTVATEAHSPANSDMEMEDDISGSSHIDQAVSQPFQIPTQASALKKESEKKLCTLPCSVGSDAATTVLSDTELSSSSLRLGEQGPKFVPSCDDLTFGRSTFGIQSPVIGSAQATQYRFVGDGENCSAPLTDDKSSPWAGGAVECISSDKYPGQVMNGSSPFRLLQDYVSNDSSENDEESCLKDSNPETVSPVVAVSNEGLYRETGDAGPKSPYKSERTSVLLPKSGIPYRAPEYPSDSQSGIKETAPISVSSGLATKCSDTKHENQLFIDHASNTKRLAKEDASGGEWANATFSSKYEKDNDNKSANFTSNAQKIDEFGRLVREGASDSDSDDSRHARRHSKRGRSRSRSRSRSPTGRRKRRRRSPRRRRENRSRSRSWSPRYRRSRSGSPKKRRSKSRSPKNRKSRSPRSRRSRSRSPSFRHASEFSNGIMRRQMPACFDFLRGKCYRGASCRYLHHDSEKNDGSRHHKSKQHVVQLPPSSKNVNTHDDSKKSSLKVSDLEQEIMNRESRHNRDMPAGSILASKDDIIGCTREDSLSNAFVNPDRISSGPAREVTVKEPEAGKKRSENVTTSLEENLLETMESDRPRSIGGSPSKLATDTKVLELHGEASKVVLSSLKDSVVQQLQPVLSHPVLEGTDRPYLQTDDSSISDPSPDKTIKTFPNKLCTSEPFPTSADSAHNPSQLPPFPPAPNSENNTLHATQPSRDYSLMPHSVASHSQSASLESFPSYMLPHQSSLFSVPPKSSLASMLPPPPPPSQLPANILTANAGSAQPDVSLQFQQSGLPPRSDFGSQFFSIPPYSTELSGNSQVGQFQLRAYPSVQEPHRLLSHVEDFRLKPLPGSNPSSQQFSRTGILGEDHSKQLPVQDLGTSDSFTRNNNYLQPMTFSQESSAIKMQNFPGQSSTPGEILKSSQIHPYLQPQQPMHDLDNSVPGSAYDLHGKISSSTRYTPDHRDRNQSLHQPDFGVTRSSTHFNPYVSTFEKPLSSRFSSDVFRQEKDTTYVSKHDPPFSLNHASVDVQGVGSRQTASSPISARGAGKIIPGSGGDQYDPIFDSIEPSSNSYKRFDPIQKWEPSGDSDIISRLKGPIQALDVEENNRRKEPGSITLAASLDNEEFGETADAEVGDVENGSQSNPDALANTNMGEIEIDQIKSPGKSRKSKESRSIKLFKACVADFVKEVLKPSWRQGNMSKETFKTVVKKTVDKVAGAMKSHQIPKSKAKINQYINSSQRKLTKLVMGYVDKYAEG